MKFKKTTKKDLSDNLIELDDLIESDKAQYLLYCPRCECVHIFNKNTNEKCKKSYRKFLEKDKGKFMGKMFGINIYK